jgi:uncharacterized membrane protein YidH (DUF202 family)
MMSQTWVRAIVGLVAFAVVLVVGINLSGSIDLTPDEATGVPVGFNRIIAILGVALVVAFVAYALTEYAQTRRLESITSQFDTRTIVLIPIAIAINIILGQTVAAALKIPVYLDSIGTILVGVLAGPIAGAATGLLSNLSWTFLLAGTPFGSPFAWPFAIVAAVIGFVAGIAGQAGAFRPRPGTPSSRLVVAAVVAIAVLGGLAVWGVVPFYRCADAASGTFCVDFLNPAATDPAFRLLGIGVVVVLLVLVVAVVVRVARSRDLGVMLALLAGAGCGVIAAFVAAPIAALVFGGVTGSGTDFLVALYQQAGADLASAVLQQSLISDPIDKALTFVIVFTVLASASRRVIARFPQGDRAIGTAEA